MVQDVSDPAILQILDTKAKKWVEVKICTASRDDSTKSFDSVEWTVSKKPYLHAKVFIVDASTFFVGSTNFTENAIDQNREVMAQVYDPSAQKILSSFFQKDCIQ